MRAGHDANARADRGAIARCADELDLDPILLVAAVIAQQRRRIIHIQNQHVDVAVVVVIAERGTATRKLLRNSRTHLRRNVLESSVAETAIHETWILELLSGVVPLYFRIHVAVDL